MNTKTLKGMGAAASLLIGIGTASPALATSTGPQLLGPAPNSIDVWTFRCPAGTVSANARVQDTLVVVNLGALMQVVLSEDGVPTVSATDFTEGGAPSPAVVVPFDGAGLEYVLALKKTAVGVESYAGEAVCITPAGIFHPFLTNRINQ